MTASRKHTARSVERPGNDNRPARRTDETEDDPGPDQRNRRAQQRVVSKSIDDLYETVLASSLRDSEFVSHLLVDLLDRNLYERSDDCRWWALTPELQAALAAPERDGEMVERITGILEYINRLYTVYTRIFVYDASGCIVASTQPDQEGGTVLGTFIEADTLAQVRALRSEQDYCVTPFAPSPLYGGRPTYVYHAAIRDPDDDAGVVGGIGIVFDSKPELDAMLRSGLGHKAGINALFVDRRGCVIASTDPTRPVGTRLEMDQTLLALPNGSSASRIVIHDGHYAIMGCTVSSGYREFKVSDGYREDVLALVFDSFGEVRERPGVGHQGHTVLQSDLTAIGGLNSPLFYRWRPVRLARRARSGGAARVKNINRVQGRAQSLHRPVGAAA